MSHFHKNEDGFLVKCYHSCRGILTDPRFWIGVTLSYPFEHLLWTEVPPFSYVSAFLGLV